jgi:hypothetical protein
VHRFENLKTLYIDMVSIPEFPVQTALSLLLLPKLEDLTLGSWGACTIPVPGHVAIGSKGLVIGGQPWIWPIRSSPITRLSLIRSAVSEDMLTKFIGACKTLKHFECTQPRTFRLRDEWFGGLVPAFLVHTESLEELSIGFVMEDQDLESYGYALLGSLSEIRTLKSLRAPLHLLCSTVPTETFGDRLPPNLEHLRFELPKNADAALTLHLPNLHRKILEGRLPSLQSIEVHWPYSFDCEGEFPGLESSGLELLNMLLEVMAESLPRHVSVDVMLNMRDDYREWAVVFFLPKMKTCAVMSHYVQVHYFDIHMYCPVSRPTPCLSPATNNPRHVPGSRSSPRP